MTTKENQGQGGWAVTHLEAGREMLCWPGGGGGGQSQPGRHNTNNQNITQTTRNKHAQTPSLIDLILTNDNHMVNDIKHIAPLGKSDHDVILFNLNLHIDTYHSPEIVLNNKGDYDNFRSFVDSQDWEVLTDANIEDTWSMIKDTLNQGTSEFVPKCKIKNTYKPPRLNKSATKAIKS